MTIKSFLVVIILASTLLYCDARISFPRHRKWYRSNTTTKDESKSMTITDERTFTRSVTRQRTKSYYNFLNISNPISANVTLSVTWTNANRLNLEKAITSAIQVLYPGAAVRVYFLKFRRLSASSTIVTFTFRGGNQRFTQYEAFFRALVEDWAKIGAFSRLRQDGAVTSLRINAVQDPRVTLVVTKTSSSIKVSAAMTRAGTLHYALFLQTSTNPITPTAPTVNQLTDPLYARQFASSTASTFKFFGRKVCQWATPLGCTFQDILGFTNALSGRTYTLYTAMTFERDLGLSTTRRNHTTEMQTTHITTEFSSSTISGSTLTCDKTNMRFSCAGTANEVCTTLAAMATQCSIAVKTSQGTAATACVKGTNCLGITNHEGHFEVEVLGTQSFTSISTQTVANRPNGVLSGTVSILGSQVAASSVNVDGTTQLINFVVNTPSLTVASNYPVMKIRAKLFGTSTYLATDSGATEFVVMLRDIIPDGNSKVNCTYQSGGVARFSSGTWGTITSIPTSLIPTPVTANIITTGVPSSSICSGQCPSVVTCIITPQQSTTQGRALLSDFVVYTENVQGSIPNVTVSGLTGTSSGCTCNGQTLATCPCSDSTYSFTVTTVQDTLRVPNLNRISFNVSNQIERGLTMDFNVNYGNVVLSPVIDMACNQTGASTLNNVIPNRRFACYVAIRDANFRAYPLEASCLKSTITNSTSISELSTITAIRSEGIFFTFFGTTGDYGKCQGTNNLACRFSIVLGGSSCGISTEIVKEVVQEHGVPTAQSTASCTTFGLSTGSMRIGSSTATCSILPRDDFGPITCCRGGGNPFTFSASNGATLTAPTLATDFKTLVGTLTPPASLPLGGSIVVSPSISGVAMATTTIYIVDYPSANSSLSCSSTTVSALQVLTCQIFVYKGASESFADPTDFFVYLSRNTAAGTITNWRTNYTSGSKREILFDFVASAATIDFDFSAYSRFYDGNLTRGSDDVRFNSSLQLRGSPLKITITYGIATTASKLTCVDTKIAALQTLNCSIEVFGASGKTAINPASIPFVVAAGSDFSITNFTTLDGSMVYFLVSAKSSALIGSITNIQVTLNGANITGSSFGPVAVVGVPIAENTTLSCEGGQTNLTGIRPATNLSCTIVPGNFHGRTKALATDFEVTTTGSTLPSALQTADGGSTFTFFWVVPTDIRTATSFLVKLNVRGVASSQVTVNVRPGDPSSSTSTISCLSRLGNGTVEIMRQLQCTVTIRDAVGNLMTSVFPEELTTASDSGTASLVSKVGDNYVFNWTSNVNAPVKTNIAVSIRGLLVATASISVVYGTPTPQNSVLACPSTSVTSSGLSCTITAQDLIGFTTSQPDVFDATISGSCSITEKTRSLKGDQITIKIALGAGNTTCQLRATLSGTNISGSGLNLIPNQPNTGTPSPTGIVTSPPSLAPFPKITLLFPGTRGTVGSAVFGSADKVLVVASHASVSGADYTWSATTTKTASVTVGPFSSNTVITVTITAAGYTTGTASATVTIAPFPIPGSLTSNASAVLSLGKVTLTCSNFSYASGVSLLRYTYARVSSSGTLLKLIGDSSSTSLVVPIEYESANTTYYYACSATSTDYGTQSNYTAGVAVNVQSVVISSTDVTNLINKITQLPTTGTPTESQRNQYAQDINTAASALDALGNSSDVANSLLTTLSSGIQALTTQNLTNAEKDTYAAAIQKTLTKISSADTATATKALAIMDASAKVPLTQRAANNLCSAVDSLVSLLKKTKTSRFRELAVDATTRNIGNAYRSAYNAARAYLFTPGTPLGTKWSTTGSTYILDGVVDVQSNVRNAFPQQFVQTSGTTSQIVAGIHFTFSVPPINLTRQRAVYAFALGDANNFVSTETTVSLGTLTNIQVSSYDLDQDKTTTCVIQTGSAKCAEVVTVLPPVYYVVFADQPIPTPPVSTNPVTAQPVTPSPVTPSSAPIATPSPPGSSSSNVGLIVGVVVGVGGALLLGGVAIFCYLRRRRDEENQQGTANAGNGPDFHQNANAPNQQQPGIQASVEMQQQV
eukprot:PhF_6_TR37514/c0_g1_i2/m.55452